jgi:hypothetical protein
MAHGVRSGGTVRGTGVDGSCQTTFQTPHPLGPAHTYISFITFQPAYIRQITFAAHILITSLSINSRRRHWELNGSLHHVTAAFADAVHAYARSDVHLRLRAAGHERARAIIAGRIRCALHACTTRVRKCAPSRTFGTMTV